MKLLLENWRKYLTESEKADSCGHLYLFEDDNVTKTSFYDALTTLSESGEDHTTFLENWEKSIDYQLENLQELSAQDIKADPVNAMVAQGYVTLGRLKDKALKPVFSLAAKLNDYADKNPSTGKAIKYTVGGLLAAVAVFGVVGVLNSGGDASDVMELAQSLQPEDPELARELAECAQEFTPEKVAEFAQEQSQNIEQVADGLSASEHPGAKQIAQIADTLAQDTDLGQDEWGKMFDKAEQMDIAQKAQSGADMQAAIDSGGASGHFGTDFERLKLQVRGGQFDEKGIKSLAKAVRELDELYGIFPDEKRSVMKLFRGKNPTKLMKFLQKLKLAKSPVGAVADGQDEWDALFGLGREVGLTPDGAQEMSSIDYSDMWED
jgi:hypothetical protein